MKVVIAIDSFKGCMSSVVAGNAAKHGLLSVIDAEASVFPVADGGEGTTRVLTKGLRGNFVSVSVHDPLGKLVEAEYGILPGGNTAVMEMAQASGLTLISEEEKDPLNANTAGVGEMILDAVNRGVHDFVIGIGGSATTEAGIGMLYALGYRFFDNKGDEVLPYLKYIGRIAEIRDDRVPEKLDNCSFHIACDVTNPLCGENGAVYVYGRQKGVKSEQMVEFDAMLSHFADVTESFTGFDNRNIAGAGAAGGLGFAFSSFMKNVEMLPGIQVVSEAIGLNTAMSEADIVLTGEGKIDMQTRNGKVPYGIAKMAKEYGCRVIAFGGRIEDGAAESLYPIIDKCYEITPADMPLDIALREDIACENMRNAVATVFADIK